MRDSIHNHIPAGPKVIYLLPHRAYKKWLYVVSWDWVLFNSLAVADKWFIVSHIPCLFLLPCTEFGLITLRSRDSTLMILDIVTSVRDATQDSPGEYLPYAGWIEEFKASES